MAIKRLPHRFLRPGDEVWVRATVTAQNVGGQLEVETRGAFYQAKTKAWVERADCKAAESLWRRLKRRAAGALFSMAFRVSPDGDSK